MTASSMQVSHPTLTHSTKQTPADVDPVAVLDALNDGVCRRILVTCDERARTAQECAAACDVPLSTVYRKLGTLTDAALLAERVRIDAERNFPSEFRTQFDTLSVSLTGGDAVEIRQAVTDGGVDEDDDADEVSRR